MNKDLFQPLDQEHTQEPHHHLKGVLLMLAFAFFGTCIAAFARKLQESTTIPMVILFQSVAGILFTLPTVIKHHFKEIKKAPFGLLAIRSIAGWLNTGMLFLAIKNTSLANAVLLNNAAPFLVPFIAFFWLQKKIDRKIWPGILLGFFGILLILKPSAQAFNFGALYALVGAVFLAVVMVSVGLLSKREKGLVIMFYFFATGLLLSLPFCLLDWQIPTQETLLILIAVGVITVIAQWLFMLAFRFGSATQLSPFTYSTVAYAALFDWIFWDKIPGYLSIIGIVLVAIAGIFTILHTRPIKKPTQ